MNDRANFYAVEAEKVLDAVCKYKALKVRQILLMFPGRESTVEWLLQRYISSKRLFRNRTKGLVACSPEWASRGNPLCEMAFWVLLDFYRQVEFHLPGSDGVTITAYTENGEYDLVAIAPGMEKAVSMMIQAQRAALSDKLFVVLRDAGQIDSVHIENVTAYCVVTEDGQTTYYTNRKRECNDPENL